MNDPYTPSRPNYRRSTPAAMARSVRCPQIGPLIRPFRLGTGRLRPASGTRDVILRVHRGKTVLPHLLKTRYKSHIG